MRIYLVRHGQAEDRGPSRPLTARGRWEVNRVAEVTRRTGVSVRSICHSGKLRAQETADIFRGSLEPPEGVRELPGLAPNDDPHTVEHALRELSGPVMFVGHLPHLSRLASLLLVGDSTRELLTFEAAGVVCLHTGIDGVWRVRWVLTPDLIGP